MAATNVGSGTDRTAMVWIEDRTGAITRGFADAMTAMDLHVRLPHAPAFGPGDVVSLRICVRREAPIVAARARVRTVDSAADASTCVLEWTPPAAGRGPLETWLAAAA
jgi:hypothetical protein